MKRIPVDFLGRNLGTASGWDGELGEVWWVYDFESNSDCKFPPCKCLQFDEVNAKIHAQDDEGNNLQSWEIYWEDRPIPV